jgi:hypothetical protein
LIQKPTGKLNPVSTRDHFVYVGQEIRDWQLGHVCLLGLIDALELMIYDDPIKLPSH